MEILGSMMIFKRSSNKKNELFLPGGGQKICCASGFFGVFSHSPITPHPFHVTHTPHAHARPRYTHAHPRPDCAPTPPRPRPRPHITHTHTHAQAHTGTRIARHTHTRIAHAHITPTSHAHARSFFLFICLTFAQHLPKITYFQTFSKMIEKR
jgi:hypothetical protein